MYINLHSSLPLQQGYQNSVVLKRVLFEAFDAYSILFYLAIYERDALSLRLELVGAFNVGEYIKTSRFATVYSIHFHTYLHPTLHLPQIHYVEYLQSACCHGQFDTSRKKKRKMRLVCPRRTMTIQILKTVDIYAQRQI